MPVIDKAERIRALNDELRHTDKSRTLVMTRGVALLPAHVQRQMIVTLARFADFDDNNDPDHEHDFGVFEVEGARLFFKIDYYDRSGRCHSPDPADPAVTRRVLTLMLADEY